jgi:Flp pilus assembly protein TadG
MRRFVSWGFARARRDVRGAAAVEFALILPILLVLVFGIVNYGDMLSVRQSVSQAASEGARAAAVNPGDNAAKIAAGRKAVDAALDAQDQQCSATGCTVTIAPCEGEITKSCATVVVEIDYDGIIAGFGLVLPDTLSYTAVARVS